MTQIFFEIFLYQKTFIPNIRLTDFTEKVHLRYRKIERNGMKFFRIENKNSFGIIIDENSVEFSVWTDYSLYS